MINVTNRAVKWIKLWLEEEEKSPAEFGFRLGVKGGGCSGFEYAMSFDQARDGDLVIEKDGAKVFIDPKSDQLVDGSTLDYLKRLQGAGFVVINPKVTSSCGCGSSFSL